eukprot:805421-Rhodomonas_salina.1
MPASTSSIITTTALCGRVLVPRAQTSSLSGGRISLPGRPAGQSETKSCDPSRDCSRSRVRCRHSGVQAMLNNSGR